MSKSETEHAAKTSPAFAEMFLFHTWSVDFMEPLPVTKSGKKYLTVALEPMSRW